MHIRKLLTAPAVRSCVRRNYGDHHHVVQSTYNDLPQPQGSWKTNYDANQRKYTAHLILGIGAFAGTLVFGKAMGYLEFYHDFPERPAANQSYK